MKRIKYLLLIVSITGLTSKTFDAHAQLTGMQAMYFENQYLVNPAMAGITNGLNLNIGYQAQWTSIPGSPKLQNFTADYNSGNRVGLGMSVNSDQSGLINRTRALATYAYHLPLSADDKINFGLSVGANSTYIDYSKINGDASDVAVQAFNQQRLYLDGDLGVSYTTHGLDLQGVVPNLGSIFFSKQGTNLSVDRSTFYTSISYKLPFMNRGEAFNNQTGFVVEPKVAFRGVKGFTNIIDAGCNIDMQGFNFNTFAFYHTNQSITAGVGINITPVRLLFSYTNNTGPLGTYANNTFEFGLKYSLLNR